MGSFSPKTLDQKQKWFNLHHHSEATDEVTALIPLWQAREAAPASQG